jgi:hypothetical protein
MSGGLDFSRFILGTQAPGAQVKSLYLAIDKDAGGVDIGRPAPVGMAFGVADIMTELRRFAAQIALQFPDSPLISSWGIANSANT